MNVEHLGAQQVQLELWLQHHLIAAPSVAALNHLQSHQQGFFRHTEWSQKKQTGFHWSADWRTGEGTQQMKALFPSSFLLWLKWCLKERKPSLKKTVRDYIILNVNLLSMCWCSPLFSGWFVIMLDQHGPPCLYPLTLQLVSHGWTLHTSVETGSGLERWHNTTEIQFLFTIISSL